MTSKNPHLVNSIKLKKAIKICDKKMSSLTEKEWKVISLCSGAVSFLITVSSFPSAVILAKGLLSPKLSVNEVSKNPEKYNGKYLTILGSISSNKSFSV